MKIVYALDQYWPAISGVPVSADTFKNELIKLKHTVYVFAPDYPGANEIDSEMDNKNVYRFASYGLFFSKADRLVYPFERKKIHKTLDTIKPDLIHVQTEFTMGNICLAYAKKRNIPVVCTSHTNWEDLVNLYLPFLPHKLGRLYSRFKVSRFFNRAACVIVPTAIMKNLLLSYKIKKPIEIIPTGIARSDFEDIGRNRGKKDSEYIKKYPVLAGKKILLAAGRIGKEKNIPFLLDVLQKLIPEFPEIILVIAGDGPFREELQDLVKMKGLSDNVIFTGFIHKKDMKKIYTLSDILVFASKVETQGLVTIEAMFCGTPVVAIGEMGTKEVMHGDNGGFMVEDNLEIFTDKVRQLLVNTKLYKSKSKEARQFAEDWTIDKFIERLLKIYQSLVKKQ